MATATSPPLPPSSEQHRQQPQPSAVVCKPRPLMLKDFLREDQNSDSFGRRFTAQPTSRWGATGAGAASANTVRYLLTLELNNASGEKRKGTGGKPRNAAGCSGGGGGGNNPLARQLSAVINALKMLPFSNSSASRASLTCGTTTTRPTPRQQGGTMLLPRSLSKRLRRSFWRSRGHDRTGPCDLASRKVLVRDIVRRASLDDDRMGLGGKVTASAATTTTTTLPCPPSPPATAMRKPKQALAATTSTAGSSPSRPSCSTSTSTSTRASSWSELDSDSFSRSGSESVGSSSSPVPEFAKPIVRPAAAAATNLPAEKKRAAAFEDHGNGVSGSPARRSVGGGGMADVPTLAPTPTERRYIPEAQGEDGKGDNGMHFTCVRYEEKDQLSPVAVVDFPSSEDEEENDDRTSQSDDGTQLTLGADEEEEEEEAEEPSSVAGAFHQRLASIERVKHRLLWKIQKFETLADLVDPVDLTDAFDAETAESVVDGDTYGDECSEYDCEQEEEEDRTTSTWTEDGVQARARELLERLKASAAAAADGTAGWGSWWDHEALLLDLFIQGLWEHEDRTRSGWRCSGTVATSTSRCVDDEGGERVVEDGLLGAARDWLLASPRLRRPGAKAEAGTSKAELIKELDRNGPWGRCLDVEKGEVVAAAADTVLDSLLAELLLDMLLRSLLC